jgi:hypothetical protein
LQVFLKAAADPFLRLISLLNWIQRSGHRYRGGQFYNPGGCGAGCRSGSGPARPGPFTVFAPTDEAFAAIASDALNALVNDPNKAPLQDILRYHVFNCSHMVAKALIEGSNRKPSFTPHAGRYTKIGRVLGLGIWTPDQVLKFAQELRHERPV